PGAGGLLGELGPGAHLLELRGARIEHVGERAGEIAQRARVRDLDRVVVYLAVALDPWLAAACDGAAGWIGLRGVRGRRSVQLLDRGIGVEVTAVVKLHPFAQVKDPLRLVFLVQLPALGEAGPDLGKLVGAREVPQHQTLEYRIAEKAHALEAVVGRAGRGRH